MTNKKRINILNLLSFIFLLYASSLFKQKNNLLISEKTDIFFKPASFTFSICFVIYISLFIWIIKGFLSTPKENILYKDVRFYFPITMIFAGISFLVPLKLSFLFSIGSLFSSIIVYIIIDESDLSKIYKIPFSIFTSWLIIITIINISIFLKTIGFTSFLLISQITLTIIVSIFTTFIAILFTLAKDDIIFPIIFIWSYIGIMFENPCSTFLIRSMFFMCLVLIATILFNISNKDTSIKKITN